MKELRVYKDGHFVGYFFLPPKKIKATSQSFWCTQLLHGINWSSGYEKYTELEKILKNLEATETEFFAKGYEKCKILSEFFETKIINIDDYTCTKVQFLMFKDEELDWRCSNYPFRQAKTLHCAERKAFAYGTRTRCFLTNCKIIILMYYHFQTLIKFHCQPFLFRVKMVDQCDEPENLQILFLMKKIMNENHGNSLDVHVIDLI